MRKPEIICGLPFYTPTRKMEEFMKIRELTEELILLKRKYEIYYPDDNYLNFACNILEKLPQNIEVSELLDKMSDNKEGIAKLLL